MSIGTVDLDGRRFTVSLHTAFDGVEYVGRLWFTDESFDDDPGSRPRCAGWALDRRGARGGDALTPGGLRPPLSSGGRREAALPSAAAGDGGYPGKVRYMNQVAISMRAGLLDADGRPGDRAHRAAAPRTHRRAPPSRGRRDARAGGLAWRRSGDERPPRAGAKSKRVVGPRPARRSKALRGEALHQYALEVLERLRRAYPDARTELNYRTPFQLLVATILSAQTTDVRVNMVTPALFERYPDADALTQADQAELESIIRSTGFFHSKAKSLMGMAQALVDRYGGTVPASMDELVTLPGVGRKTANVVLGNAFGRNDGVVVDTHVGRLAVRLGFTKRRPCQSRAGVDGADPAGGLDPHLTSVDFPRAPRVHRPCPACPRCVLVDICPTGQQITGMKNSRGEEQPG